MTNYTPHLKATNYGGKVQLQVFRWHMVQPLMTVLGGRVPFPQAVQGGRMVALQLVQGGMVLLQQASKVQICLLTNSKLY